MTIGEMEEAYQLASKGVSHPDLACTEEETFYSLLRDMGVSLEQARENCTITIEDGVVWITPRRKSSL